MVGPLACPICRTRPPRRACGNRVFASAHCPVCLETCEPVVALPCGHALCEGCFGRIPGGALLVDGQSVGAAARPTEDTRASEAQDRDATRQWHAEAEDAAARREAVERSQREAAEERERRAAVERSRREAERARAELRAARDEAARREAARAREAAARERPSYNAAFAVNQRVEVRCRGGDQWFTGKITAVRDGCWYDILYDDGESEARVAESLIRRWVSTPHTGAPASARPSADAARDEAARREAARARERDEAARREAARAREAAARERPSYSAAFAVNQRVEVRWRGGNQWFTGKITAIRGDRLYDILYDDEDSEARVAESRIRRWVARPHTGQ